MVTAARPGERGGRRARIFPSVSTRLRAVAGALVLLLALAHAPVAQAGSLYRCTGSRGEAVFSSSRAGYHGCRRIRIETAPQVQAAAPAASGPAHEPGAGPAAEGWHYRQGNAGHVPRLPPGHALDAGTRVLRGAVYRVEHADGSIEYTNVRPRGAAAREARTRTLFTYIATCMACDIHSKIDWQHVPLQLSAYAGAIRAAASAYGVDPSLLRAVIHAESAFNPQAVSARGAQGLMQLMPSTATDMGVKDAFDAAENIRGGARYLALLLKTFHGNDRLATAAYNAGPEAVRKYDGVPPYVETRVYVRRVSVLHRRYRAAMQHADTLASSGPGRAD